MVYGEYDMLSSPSEDYEIDHLISLELGGSNDIANLWPEAAEPSPGYHEKDALENKLHEKVCAGDMTLDEARRAISSDWLNVYERLHTH